MFKSRKLYESENNEVIELFDNAEFFFHTKRPDSLTEKEIHNIIYHNDRETYMIENGERVLGLLSVENDPFEVDCKRLAVRFVEMEISEEYIERLIVIIDKIIGNCKMMTTQVYEFDSNGIRVVEKMFSTRAIIMKNHIYKNGRFFDMYLYSKNRRSTNDSWA